MVVMSSESSKITRLVYYSLAIMPFGSREAQWIQSIRSLRRYNRDIPVQLFLFNGAPAAIIREAHRQRVEVFELGDYAQYLDGLSVHGSLLAQYPTFHKFLVLRHSPARAANHILYLDCDTFFFGDVETLFRRYGSFDWCAREEPCFSRKPSSALPVSSRRKVFRECGEGCRTSLRLPLQYRLLPYEPRYLGAAGRTADCVS